MRFAIDVVVLLIIAFYLFDGYRNGFIKNFIELIGFIFSLFIAFIVNQPVANFLVSNFPLPLSLSKIVAFLIIWLLVDIIYSIIVYFINRTIPDHLRNSKVNKIFGLIPAFFKSIIVILLVLIFLTSLPLLETAKFKREAQKSYIASIFLGSGSIFQRSYEKIFGQGIEDLVNFFTLPPQSDKIVALNYKTHELKVDENSENQMLASFNEERRAKGVPELVMDDKLRELARSHSKDMLERGYFSHYTPEGLSPFDRMRNANINYIVAGENLAMAPDVEKAIQGLMNSTGHRDNILNPNFGRAGIGVIDAGIYGKMFTQEFTN